MKPYKLERWKNKQKEKNPTKNKRLEKLREETKKIALADFEYHTNPNYAHITWGGVGSFRFKTLEDEINDKDGFRYELYWNLKDRGMNIQWSDLDIMFPLYQQCIRRLEANKKRADFMEKKYVPLQEDLFEI